MSKLFLVAFLIANVFFAQGVFLKKSSTTTVNHLRSISESDFGKRILDTIAL
jgi:regulatory protein YycI of two-component signal transduction system YycFG